MKIYVTTLGRCRDQKTLLNLPPHLRRETVLVVQDHEWTEHDYRWRGFVGEVRALRPEVRTLGATRREVFSWAEDQKIVLLDDDLDFYVRKDPEDWHLLPPTDSELAGMFGEIDDALNYHFHVGVSGREGNNRVYEYHAHCVRYMRLLAYRTDMPASVEHGRIDGMSDFDVNMQLLRMGCASLIFYRYAQGQSQTQAEGGISSQRSHDRHEAEVDWMVREHAPYVTKVEKKNKTGGDFGTRAEVHVEWKLAYERSILG